MARRGRKPGGPFSGGHTRSVALRLDLDLHAKLEASTEERKKRNKNWNFSQELQWRLRQTFEQDRRDPVMRALAFLMEKTARRVHMGAPLAWRHNPFLFKAFRLAFAQVLERLQPRGEIASPLSGSEEVRNITSALEPRELQFIADRWKTPEETAARVAESINESLNMDPFGKGVHSLADAGEFKEQFEKEFPLESYDFADVKRDLNIEAVHKSREPNS